MAAPLEHKSDSIQPTPPPFSPPQHHNPSPINPPPLAYSDKTSVALTDLGQAVNTLSIQISTLMEKADQHPNLKVYFDKLSKVSTRVFIAHSNFLNLFNLFQLTHDKTAEDLKASREKYEKLKSDYNALSLKKVQAFVEKKSAVEESAKIKKNVEDEVSFLVEALGQHMREPTRRLTDAQMQVLANLSMSQREG